MAWTHPDISWSTGEVVTAASFNESMRDMADAVQHLYDALSTVGSSADMASASIATLTKPYRAISLGGLADKVAK